MTNGRNHEGEIDPEGEIWAAPYRWGSMVIAYKKSKFQEHKLAPIEGSQDIPIREVDGNLDGEIWHYVISWLLLYFKI